MTLLSGLGMSKVREPYNIRVQAILTSFLYIWSGLCHIRNISKSIFFLPYPHRNVFSILHLLHLHLWTDCFQYSYQVLIHHGQGRDLSCLLPHFTNNRIEGIEWCKMRWEINKPNPSYKVFWWGTQLFDLITGMLHTMWNILEKLTFSWNAVFFNIFYLLWWISHDLGIKLWNTQ